MVLPGLQITVIGQDAKFLGANRDGYYPDDQYAAGDPLKPQRVPNPSRGNVETQTNRVDPGPGASPGILAGPLPHVAGLTLFTFYDREVGFLNGASPTDTTAGYGGMRTEVHVYPKNGLARPDGTEIDALTGPDSQDAFTVSLTGAQKPNFTNSSGTWMYADGSPRGKEGKGKREKERGGGEKGRGSRTFAAQRADWGCDVGVAGMLL